LSSAKKFRRFLEADSFGASEATRLRPAAAGLRRG
jgi:hypothetical protein